MRKLLLASAALTGMFTLTALNASAAPATALIGVQAEPSHALVTNVDYYYNHHHYHHRRRDERGHWHYWD
ncbi:hypothetical protein [Rhodopila sp.]|uniref:hypothetical protein n=1 Tax=Rhodopila sp. TaxID=2480087 RepID=UPI003D147FED